MANRKDYVYDELICFLGDPLFQVPTITFIEQYCIIFEPSGENKSEYEKLHKQYGALTGKLLDAFMKDSGLNYNEILRALKDMNSKTDLREVFQALFEQVLAMDDYTIFVRLMTQKNIELQQQALAMIMQRQGSLPSSLQEGPQQPEPQPSPKGTSVQQNEDDVLKAVLEQSKKEYEEEQKKKKSATEDKAEVDALLKMTQEEHSRLEKERIEEKQRLDLALQNLTVHGDSPSKVEAKPVPSAASTAKPPPSKPVSQTDLKSAPSISVTPAPVAAPAVVPVAAAASVSISSTTSQKLPAVGGQKPQMSSADAAANWMKSAHEESAKPSSHSFAVSAAAAQMSNLSPDELVKRQAYLKEQRDKLLEMKKKEREKQLLAATSSQPQRPMSARAARSALEKSGANADQEKKLSPEEEKKLAMRKAIADRLKAEMLGGK